MQVSKKSRKWRVRVAIAGSLVLLVFVAILLHGWPPLWYYLLIPGVRELPPGLTRPAFRAVTGRELPPMASGLRGIFSGGVDPGIFVRFETDPAGIEYTLEAFAGPSAKLTSFRADVGSIPRPLIPAVFPVASTWEKKVGTSLFDQDSIGDGRILECPAGVGQPQGYKIFIDDERGLVYIYAYHI